jgi:prepilin-type N-terminal cleavage/methylation domain-containing protein
MRYRIRSTRSLPVTPAAPSARRGMTLIEVMIALSIVTSAMLGLGAFLPNFMHVSAKGTILSAASDLAVSRLETIKTWPTYSSLETTYNATESSFANCRGCSRVTLILHTTNATADYKTVTVTVSGPNITTPVAKTTVIAAF